MGARTEFQPASRPEHEVSPATIPYSLTLQLTVRDPDSIDALQQFEAEEAREQYALTALQIGVAALRQAQGRLDADAVRRESDRMIASLDGQLREHATHVNRTLTDLLKQYFDPQSGRFEERVKRLVAKDGELESVMRNQLGKDSELGKTLAGYVGESSPLMRMLDPDQSKGILAAMRTTVDEKLREQREHVIGEFSLDNEQSSLSRLVKELTTRQGELSDKLRTKIDEVVKEFSLDQEDSALSRLVRNVDRAQRTITNEFSLDDEHSALARLKRELTGLFEKQEEKNHKFQQQVTNALQAMTARKEEAQKSTRHGLEFEDAVFEFLQREAQQTGDIATHTGNTTGLIKSCKIGDAVVELGPESASAGARIAFEAKQSGSYNLADARREVEQARKNRDAQIGVFVFSVKSAPVGLEPLARYGEDIVVVWDAEDAHTDVYFRVAISMARALCVRSSHARSAAEDLDFELIDAAILEIEKRAAVLGDIQKSAEAIGNHSDKILSKVNTTRKSLEKQVGILRDETKATKEVVDDLLAD